MCAVLRINYSSQRQWARAHCTGHCNGGDAKCPELGILRLDLQWSQSSHTVSPPLFPLSNELVNSQLLQYESRTALSGVVNPLDPGLSLPDRPDALERWETAWMELDLREPNASIDAPIPAKSGPPVAFSFGRYFAVIREGCGISAGYSFLDMHARSSPHTTTAQWTTVEINTPNVLVFAFSSELNLAVAISYVR